MNMAMKIQSRKGPVVDRKPLKRARGVIAPKKAGDSSVRDFLLSIAEMGEQIPAEVRAKIPMDAAKNLDHYLYGHPKVN
jgi:hypothetical protein